jgi:protein phosphatase
MPDNDEDTAVFIAGEPFAKEFFDASLPRLRFLFGAATHTGNVRRNNEDHYAIVRRRRTSELLLSNLDPADLSLADDSDFALIVADGMGGARFGEFASRVALQRMFELAQQSTSWVMKLTNLDVLQIRQRVEAYVQEIQATLRDYVAADPALLGMGTTWTSAHLMQSQALVVHIGDSRAYVVHDGELRQITHDETMAQAFIDAGLDPESVKKFRHLILNNLGGESDKVTAQIHHLQIDPGDRLLLCTDGLTDMLEDDDIAAILQQTSAPQDACDRLIAAALDRGGKDNVTVALAAVGG